MRLAAAATTCLSLLTAISALKFDLEAIQPGYTKPRCIKDYVGSDTLVVVTAWVGGAMGDGQKVDIEIGDTNGNQYGKKRNVVGESRSAFTIHEDTYITVCFKNELQSNGQQGAMRHIELDIDIGADALDWSAIQKAEKLQPMEAELRRIEQTLQEVVNEMEYLKTREQKLRDTNESTNERVKGFAILGIITLFGSGVWRTHNICLFDENEEMLTMSRSLLSSPVFSTQEAHLSLEELWWEFDELLASLSRWLG